MAHTVEPPTDHPTSIVVRVKGDPIAASLSPEIELDLSKFHNGRWALQLDHGLAWRETPVVIVAYGLACHAVAWWAQLSPRSYLRAISGALFLAPLRVGRDLPGAAAAMENGPRYRLPFASIVVGDTWFAVQETLALADRWGSGFVATGEPQPGPISNRHAPLGAIEQMLLERVGRFDAGAAATPPFAGVVPPHDAMPRG
jgi:predicted alpha/beta hydrolase family esterase